MASRAPAQRIEAMLKGHPGLFFAGNSYRGVSINSCVADTAGIAERLIAHPRQQEGCSVATAIAV